MIPAATLTAVVAHTKENMALLHYECNNCDAVFKIRHDIDEAYYPINYCPFCGCELDDEHFDQEEE
jgi:predicted nucleic acid-binding Zn ribbon protein